MLVWIEETTDDMIKPTGSVVCSPTSTGVSSGCVLLIEVLLVEFLPLVVLLAVEGEMVLAESLFLEKKERIPPELEIPKEEGELLLFWRFVCALVLLAPFLFCWLDWGASAPLLLVLADALVC